MAKYILNKEEYHFFSKAFQLYDNTYWEKFDDFEIDSNGFKIIYDVKLVSFNGFDLPLYEIKSQMKIICEFLDNIERYLINSKSIRKV